MAAVQKSGLGDDRAMAQEARVADPVSLHRKNLAEQVFEILEQRIVSGTLAPGSRLSEEAIAEEFSTSRSPVRDVLNKLERLGFAERVGARDRRVQVPTARLVADTYETWIILEVGRTYTSSQGASAADHDEIRLHIGDMSAAWNEGRMEVYARLSEAFPEMLHRRCDNMQLLSVLSDFEKYRTWLVAVYLRNEPPNPDSLVEHRMIAEHYVNRDLIGLTRSIQVHVRQQRDRVLAQVPALL